MNCNGSGTFQYTCPCQTISGAICYLESLVGKTKVTPTFGLFRLQFEGTALERSTPFRQWRVRNQGESNWKLRPFFKGTKPDKNCVEYLSKRKTKWNKFAEMTEWWKYFINLPFYFPYVAATVSLWCAQQRRNKIRWAWKTKRCK